MTVILDHFFNSVIMLFLSSIILGFVFYFSARMFLKKPAGKQAKETPVWLQVVSLCIGVMGPIVLGATNQLVCGFGFSDTLAPVGRRGDVMLLQAVSETEDSSSYRLYGINLETGKQLFRRNFRSRNLEGKLEAWNGSHIWFNPTKRMLHSSSREIFAVSAATGETLFELDAGDLAKKAGLKAVIGKIESVTGDNTVIVQTKDGLWTEIDPVKFSALRQQDNPIIPINPAADFRIEKADCVTSVRVKEILWRLEGNPRMRLMFDEDGGDRVPGAPGMAFIHGCFVKAFSDIDRIPVLSWEDSDRKHFLLHVFSADGKMLWQLEGRKLEDLGMPSGPPSVITRNRDSLVLLLGGHMVSININSGNINWHLRL